MKKLKHETKLVHEAILTAVKHHSGWDMPHATSNATAS